MMIRILVAVIAIPALVLIIFLTPAWALGLMMGLIAACCAWEFLRCVETDIKLGMLVCSFLAAFLIPFGVSIFVESTVYLSVLFLLFAACFGELMLSFRKENPMDFETVASCLMAGGLMPVLLSTIVSMRTREYGSVCALLPFVVAFSTDSGAYFAGVFFGRTALAPRLSPNKTIEGSLGGFLAAVVLTLVYGLVLFISKIPVNFPVLCAYGFLGSLAGQMGDLSFSAVKRLCGKKDYGSLIPGHGGMLDRFDSMFWTAGLIALLEAWVPPIG